MQLTFFRNYRQHLRSMYTERNKDEEKQNLDSQNIVWFNFGKGEIEKDGKLVSVDHPKEVWVPYTYNVKDHPRCVCYYKKRNLADLDTPPPPLYSCVQIPEVSYVLQLAHGTFYVIGPLLQAVCTQDHASLRTYDTILLLIAQQTGKHAPSYPFWSNGYV